MLQHLLVNDEIIEALSGVFDVDYYLSQISMPLDRTGAIEHYLLEGWKDDLNPHPLFSSEYYRSQLPELGRAELVPFLHYLIEGYTIGLNPHPLFDSQFYTQQVGAAYSGDTSPLEHFLLSGYQSSSPHIMFDPEYYRSQLDANSDASVCLPNPLLDYLTTENCYHVNPHPLFDTEYYLWAHPGFKDEGIVPLTYFLSHGHERTEKPHILFDNNFYCCNFPDLSGDVIPIVHFLAEGYREASSHILFDVEYYTAQFLEYVATQFQTEIDRAELLSEFFSAIPVVHYLKKGFRSGISPNQLFLPRFYIKTAPFYAGDEDPLTHYLKGGLHNHTSPHPFFDTDFYKGRTQSLEGYDPLTHFEISNYSGGDLNPSWGFHTELYKETFSNFFEINTQPVVHYYNLIGDSEREYALPFASEGHFLLHKNYHQIRGASRGIVPSRVLLAVHDLSRTGAPLIALNIAKRLSQDFGVEVFVILLRNVGPLRKQFEEVSIVIDCESITDQRKGYNYALDLITVDRPGRTVAICNSAETWPLAGLFAALDIPIIALMHEFATAYKAEPGWIKKFLEDARYALFPSSCTREDAIEFMADDLPELANRSEVVPQGLLDSRYLVEDNGEGRRLLCEELQLDQDTFIVLGSGYVDSRKGCDLFLAAADQFVRAHPSTKVAFVWVGGDLPYRQGALEWIETDIVSMGLSETVFFIGEREDTKPYFDAADVLLMCSRRDPFPCVVQEAMACATPVILFDKVNGSVDAVQKGGGLIVDFPSIEGLVKALSTLCADPNLRTQLGQEAREIILRDYCFDSYVEELLDRATATLDVPAFGSYRSKSSPAACQGERLPVFLHSPDWQISGVNTVLEKLTSSLCKQGWDARLILSRKIKETADFPPECPYQYLTSGRFDMLQDYWDAFQHFVETNAPCVVIFGYGHLINALTPALSERVGTIGLLMSDDVEYYESAYRLGRYWNRMVAVSDKIASEVVDLNPGFNSKLVTIPNSTVPLEVCQRPRRPRKSGEPLKLIYVGRIENEQKRVLDFIDLLELLDAREVNYQLTVVGEDTSFKGDDETEGEVIRTLNERWEQQLADRKIIITGRLPHEQVLELLAQHDALISLAAFEGFPLTVVEAMALGCVPIAKRIDSGIPELIQHGIDGLIAEDTVGVATQIEEMQASIEQWQQLSLNARKKISAHFTLERVTGDYSDLLESVSNEIRSGFTRPCAITQKHPDIGDVVLPAGANFYSYIERKVFSCFED